MPLCFAFRATNNEPEYVALTTGLTLMKKLQCREVSVFSNSKININQVKDAYQEKDDQMKKYLMKV